MNRKEEKLSLAMIFDYILKALKFLGSILKYILLIILIVTIILYLPDVLLHIRKLINKIPLIKKYISIFDVDNNTGQYIQIIMSILTCSITGLLSVLAYKLSKRLGILQFISQEIKQALAAQKFIKNIEENCGVIFDINRDVGDIKKIVLNKELSEDCIFLYKTSAIGKEEKNFLTKYIEVICNIKAYVDKGDDDKAKNIISKFVDEYFTSPERLAYKGDLDNTIKRLEEIDERRNENV